MAEDAGKLLELTLNPDVSQLYSDICRMQPAQLVKRLECEAVSIEGEMPELRGRLLRLEVRRAYPQLATPWYLEDEVSVERRDDSSEDIAEALWQLREASVDGRMKELSCLEDDDEFLEKAKVDRIQTSTELIEDDAASYTPKQRIKSKIIGAIFYILTYLLSCYERLPKLQLTTSNLKTTLFVAFDVVKLALYTWLLDSYVFYNKGFHIYVTVYWIIMWLYSLNEDKHRLHVYIQNYPFEHQTKLLMHSLIRVAVVAFSFTCINSFVWFDNVMLVCFIVFNFVTELCMLIREINDYENSKYAPNYFLYTQK